MRAYERKLEENLMIHEDAVIVLSEIYGINHFIKSICQKFKKVGFDVFCPNIIGRQQFSYEKTDEAYEHFIHEVGFDTYQIINEQVRVLKIDYKKVFIVGFSVGATLAWRCCENPLCDGIVCCYGSRIRDYIDLNPVNPTILLQAKETSFDVDSLRIQLEGKSNLLIYRFEAGHGFIDADSSSFDSLASRRAEELIINFLLKLKY